MSQKCQKQTWETSIQRALLWRGPRIAARARCSRIFHERAVVCLILVKTPENPLLGRHSRCRNRRPHYVSRLKRIVHERTRLLRATTRQSLQTGRHAFAGVVGSSPGSWRRQVRQ
jgi:hypothetical protein